MAQPACSGHAAQDPPSSLTEAQTEIRLLRDRIERQNRQLETLETRMDALSASSRDRPSVSANAGRSVETDSGLKVTIGGVLHTVALYSGKRPLSGAGTVFQLAPPDATGQESVFDLTAQYSKLRLSVEGPAGQGYKGGAELLVMFYNGQVLSDQYGVTPALAFAYLAGERWSVSAGRRMELFSERQPGMVDEISVLGASGNPGNSMRTQLRVEHTAPVGRDGRLRVALAASEPLSTFISSDFRDRSEDNGKPNFEVRTVLGFGPAEAGDLVRRPVFELGWSGVYGEFRKFTGLAPPFPPPRVVRVTGSAIDAGLRVGRRLGLQGEYYHGRALGNYLGGVLQTVNTATLAEIPSRGGWAEATWYWTPAVNSNLGFGVDRNDVSALAAGQPARNQTIFANVVWRVSPSWQLGLELTQRRTGYLRPDGSLSVNQGYGCMLVTQFRF